MRNNERFIYPDDPAPQNAGNVGGKFSIERLRRVHNGEGASPAYAEEYAYPGDYAAYEEPVYDAFEEDAYDAYEPAPNVQEPAPRRKKKKHRVAKVLLWLLIILLALAVLTSVVLLIFQKMPQTSEPIGTRKPGCCSVLLAGTDESGIRTDTLMVLFIDRPNKSIRLLSIPRDTMVNRDNPVP